MDQYETVATGGCQCGAIRYRTTAMLDNSHICHCRMCQKAVGNLFAALVAAPDLALSWTRGTPSVFRSSAEVDRGFCAACGTPLYYRNRTSTRTNLTIGSLDEPGRFPVKGQVGLEGVVTPLAVLATTPEDGPTGSGGHDAWAAAIRSSNRQHPDRDTDVWPPI